MKRRRRWMLAGAIVLALLVLPVGLGVLLAPVHDGPLGEHFDGVRFHNLPAGSDVDKSWLQIVRWRLTRDAGPWTQRRDAVFYNPPERVDGALRVTFVNHATVLIQADGVNVLTDPVYSERVSPFGSLGPARFREAGLRFEDLPPIDAVLISHNHYDHMELDTIRRLADRHDPMFVVALGNGHYLARRGVDQVTELDWWQSITVGELQIHAVPARHWSRRGLFDTNRALWCGFVLSTAAGPVYFAGDTGMGPHFGAIAARLGAPRLAMLPIGAYLPRWFMAPQHIDPAEAVSAHELLGAEQSMAIHFGTFRLGDDGMDQPAQELALARRAAGIEAAAFWIPGNGESRLYEADDDRIARLAAR